MSACPYWLPTLLPLPPLLPRPAAAAAADLMLTVPAGNDGGPFWWPKLCDALQKKYEGEVVALVGGEDILQAEARAILRGFVSGCQLHDTNLFGGGAD